MHLQRLELTRFRSCRETTAWFRPDLTVLVGENNGGKSSLVDAIRLLTSSADGRRTRYCEAQDLSFGSVETSLNLRATYSGLTDAEQAMALTSSDGLDQGTISHRLQFELPEPGQRRGRTTWTVGANDSLDPEPAARERIRHVFLPPLRDAAQALGSGSGDRLEFVLRTLAEPTEVEDLEAVADGAFQELQTHPLVARADGSVAEQLGKLTAGTMPQTSKLGFVEPTLRYLARALRMKLAEWGCDPSDLSHSGLGYSNLLFLATVVVELTATKDADLTIFLVEEPESHLHPQLQGAVLDFLIAAAKRDVETPGSVQVIVTTHSAQLASSVPSEHIQVVKAQHPTPKDSNAEPETSGQAFRTTKTIPIWRLPIEPDHRKKVDRYLDATRSAMLFGPRVLLVEGIAEVLLLPSLARRTLADPELHARFRATSLVGIDGVDFEPYVKVLLTPYEGVTVAEKVIVVTDGDPHLPGDRVKALEDIGQQLEATDKLSVHSSVITLEASLVEAGNTECLRSGFVAQRPQSGAVWDEAITSQVVEEHPERVVALFKEKRVLKGDLAQFIASVAENKEATFVIPEYLEEAIRAAAAS